MGRGVGGPSNVYRQALPGTGAAREPCVHVWLVGGGVDQAAVRSPDGSTWAGATASTVGTLVRRCVVRRFPHSNLSSLIVISHGAGSVVCLAAAEMVSDCKIDGGVGD